MAVARSDLLKVEKNEIKESMKKPLIKGDTWYLIDAKWFRQWKIFVGYDEWDTGTIGDPSADPGPVDNSFLLKGDKRTLKENLTDEYCLVPYDVWSKFVSCYRLAYGQIPIIRKVVEQGIFHKQPQVEVYLLELKLCSHSDMSEVVTRQFSHSDTVESLAVTMRRLFNISSSKDIRLWYKYELNVYEQLNKWETTLQDSCLYSGQLIIVESQNDDCSWSRQTKVSSLDDSRAPCNSSFNGGHKLKISPRSGLCGLRNLGNTCFMNSAIQCMSNVPLLTEYMVTDRWRKELNPDNLLGMRGEIARSYAELIKNIWSGEYCCTTPRSFKVAVGRFKPEFSGYQQQDSQELMAFLLDGLHEDLNRIKQKPYVEMKEANNRPDEEVAEEAWADYVKRNNSVVVDTFHGLLKSTLICPECKRVSVKFDPFCYLSLPLPVKKERHIEVILVPSDPMRKLCQFKLTVPKLGIVTHLCNALSMLTNIATERMKVVDVYNHRFHRIFDHEESLSNILDRDDIFIYEVPVDVGHDLVHIPVYMREDSVSPGKHSYPSNEVNLFGVPILVAVPRHDCTYDVLYNCVLDRMVRYVRVKEITPGWWKSSLTKPKDESYREDADETEANDQEDSDDSPGDNHNSKSESEGESLEKDDEDISDYEPHIESFRLFTFHAVNSYGTAEANTINDDGMPIKFPNCPYVAAHWNSMAKRLFFDEKLFEDLEVDESMSLKPILKRPEIRLADCLELFTTKERLGDHDPWFCPDCKKHQQATKKFDIWQLPRVLVIHLKRFSFTRSMRDKLDTFVRFPIRYLDMQKWIINRKHVQAVYNLIAVSNHYGGLGGGHYTTFAKNKNDDRWYHFDDVNISYLSEDSVVVRTKKSIAYGRNCAEEILPYCLNALMLNVHSRRLSAALTLACH